MRTQEQMIQDDINQMEIEYGDLKNVKTHITKPAAGDRSKVFICAPLAFPASLRRGNAHSVVAGFHMAMYIHAAPRTVLNGVILRAEDMLTHGELNDGMYRLLDANESECPDVMQWVVAGLPNALASQDPRGLDMSRAVYAHIIDGEIPNDVTTLLKLKEALVQEISEQKAFANRPVVLTSFGCDLQPDLFKQYASDKYQLREVTGFMHDTTDEDIPFFTTGDNSAWHRARTKYHALVEGCMYDEEALEAADEDGGEYEDHAET